MSRFLLALATVDTPLPAGAASFGGNFLFKVGASAGDTSAVAKIVPTPQVQFEEGEIADGAHVAQAWALDSAGNPIGDPATLPFTAPAQPPAPAPTPSPAPAPATYPAPSALTVTFN